MCMMNTRSPSHPLREQHQEEEETEKIPMEKTVYFSSRTPLHDFKLPGLAWATRKVLQCVKTCPKIKIKVKKNSTPVSKPCIKAKQRKNQSFFRPVVRERSVRRNEGLFSLSLRTEEIEEDFMRIIGRMPQRKMEVKKIFKNDKEKHEYLKYQKHLRELNPGIWLSEIYHV